MNETPLELYVQGLVKEQITNREEKPRSSIHVTDLSQPCMRRVWYDLKGIPYSFDFKTLCNFKMGNMVHEALILNKKQNEVAIKANVRKNEIIEIDKPIPKKEFYDCISGKLDDIVMFEGVIVIIDKKTFSSKWAVAVKTKIDEDYIFQLNEYKLLYWIKTGQEVKKGVIAYVDVATKMEDIRVFETDLWPIEEIKGKIIEKLNTLQSKTEPERVVSKRCLTCPFNKVCNPSQAPDYESLVKIWK